MITKEERKQISPAQKAWHYIREVNSLHSCDLNKTAITDGNTAYTYGNMFRQWERYASVFSALGMTAENHARVGIMGSDSAEAVFAIYGLNMVGAEVSIVAAFKALKPSRILQTIRDEHLTDFIMTDDFAQPNLFNELLGRKNELGLKNILLLHIPVGGSSVDPMMSAAQEAKYMYFKSWYAPICMDVLLDIYGDHPVCYAPDASSECAFILHTTGTTSGTGKPIVLSDAAFNAVSCCFLGLDRYEEIMEEPVSGLLVDMSNSYSILDQLHVPLTMGGTVAVVPGGAMNPNFYKAVPEFGFTVLFAISALLDQWLSLPENTPMDFSSLKYVILGGTSVSVKDKKRYLEFFAQHGGKNIVLLNGYGISELGGACIISTDDPEDESIGYLLPGIELRLYNEEEDRVYTPQEAPCEGVLYLTASSMASAALDGKTVMETREFDGAQYVCTNDLVRIETDGRITFLGRANRYFINETGFKYEAGRVETEVSRQPGIGNCAMAPVYSKLTHDNIPMLCVQIQGTDTSPETVIRNAFRQVFIADKTLPEDHIPYRVLIAEELPKNGNGKVDLYRISKGDVTGKTYAVSSCRIFGKLTDIKLSPVKDESAVDMIKEVFTEIKDDLKDDILLNTTMKERNENMINMNKLLTGFRAMNEIGGQMLKMMQQQPSCMGLPCMQQMMQNVMPNVMQNMQSMMSNMQGMMPNFMPNMQGTAPNMTNMAPNMPNMQSIMQGMMQNMQQANQMMMQMMNQQMTMMNQYQSWFMEQFRQMCQNSGGCTQQAPEQSAETPEAPSEE